jgi:hypothetical protein
MAYPDAAWERAMKVQDVILKALSGEIHGFRAGPRGAALSEAAQRALTWRVFVRR